MTPALINHLWHSTVVAIAAALVALALRRNQASTRHAVWLAASLKFLVPFSLLIALGASFAWRSAPTPVSDAPAIAGTVQTIAEPFADLSVASAPLTVAPRASALRWPALLGSLWLCGALVVVALRVRGWLRVRAAVRASTPIALSGIDDDVDVRATAGLLEPGVVGIWRPVLLVPVGLESTLSADQLRAVVAHERHHIRRRDNLTSMLHMAVEAVFWFHPIVWWVGARLIDERERACDEYVIASGAAPEAYAEAILNVCKRYVEQPVACVSGVTGSDLKKRLGAILAGRVGLGLSGTRKIVLAFAAAIALVVPVAAGMITAPLRATSQASGPVPKFDVVSVRPCAPGARGAARQSGGAPTITSPGRLFLECYPLSGMIQQAYVFFSDGRAHALGFSTTVGIEGTLDWMKSDRYTIEAQTNQNPPPAVMRGPMLQALLEDRFKLRVHHETREMPIYELVTAKSGAKVSPYAGHDCVIKDDAAWPPPPPPAGQSYCSAQGGVNGDQYYRSGVMTLDELAELSAFDRPVVNKTGITAPVSLHLEYPREDVKSGEPPQPSVMRAFRDQLGLDLRPSKGPRDFLVIDHAEKPTFAAAFVPDQTSATASVGKPAPVEASTAKQTFDVASIRPCAPEPAAPGARGGGGGSGRFSPGRAHFDCFVVKNLIQTAYVNQRGVPAVGLPATAKAQDDPINNYPNLLRLLDPGSPQQIRGGPAWVYSDKYTIEAEAAGLDPTSAAGLDRRTMVGPMLQALLEERFGLKLHRETEQASMYALTVAKTGLRLKPIAEDDCSKDRPLNGPPITMADALARGTKPTCGTILGGPHAGNWQYQIAGQDLGPFAHTLGSDLGVNVIDRTGVSDKFNFVWEYGPDENTPGVRRYVEMTGKTDPAPPTAPSVFAALKQLGLELEKITGTRAYFVIDHIEHPTPDESAGGPMRARGGGR